VATLTQTGEKYAQSTSLPQFAAQKVTHVVRFYLRAFVSEFHSHRDNMQVFVTFN